MAARYAFRHVLYQQVLYEQLGQARRMRIHRHIGEWKEGRYRDQATEIAKELAIHFTEGWDYRRAVQYHYQVGKTALRRSAYREAIDHCKEGLSLLERVSDIPERQQQELALRMILYAELNSDPKLWGEGVGAESLRYSPLMNTSRDPVWSGQLCESIKKSRGGIYKQASFWPYSSYFCVSATTSKNRSHDDAPSLWTPGDPRFLTCYISRHESRTRWFCPVRKNDHF